MSGINRVIITGNLTKDPELRHTGDNIPVCDLRIANTTKTRTGEDSCYIDVTAWESQAESCCECLKKGARVIVEGRLKLNEWKSKEGKNRSQIVIIAHRVVFFSLPERSINKD